MQGNVGMSMGNERVRNITKTRNGFTHGIRKGRKLGEKGRRETIIRNERGVCLEKQKKKQQKKEERDFTNAVVVMEIGSKDRNDQNWRK